MSKSPQIAAANADHSATVRALLPLYSDSALDTPDSVVGAYPNSIQVVKALQAFIDVLFPGKMSPGVVLHDHLRGFLEQRLSEGSTLLKPEIERALPFRWIGEAARHEGAPDPVDVKDEAARILESFCARLPEVRRLLIEDVKAAYEGDPAALTYAEVQLAYPGLLAIASHRVAHELYALEVPIVPRVMSEWTHSMTGVDIHPGARIGHGFFIDHGTGVVVGETTVIGNGVKIYQGVTLGARSFPLDENGFPVKHVKRHPTVEDNVVIYAHATILGGSTVIGAGATIGGNVFIMESVPGNSVVTAIHPELRIKRTGETALDWSI
jgi:serine O-acetyltransferase